MPVLRNRTLALLLAMLVAGCAPSVSSIPQRNATLRDATSIDQQQREWLDMFARGYFPGRSGQIFFVPHEGDFIVDNKDPLYAFMHGSPWPYDTDVPLLLHGRSFVRQGAFDRPVAQQDVAPTVAALLRTSAPATSTGRPLTEALITTAAAPRIVWRSRTAR
jgi:hypothetical protein